MLKANSVQDARGPTSGPVTTSASTFWAIRTSQMIP